MPQTVLQEIRDYLLVIDTETEFNLFLSLPLDRLYKDFSSVRGYSTACKESGAAWYSAATLHPLAAYNQAAPGPLLSPSCFGNITCMLLPGKILGWLLKYCHLLSYRLQLCIHCCSFMKKNLLVIFISCYREGHPHPLLHPPPPPQFQAAENTHACAL